MRGSGRWAWAVVLLLAATGWGVTRLFDVSTRGGEVFPAYSTLRSDPMGAKVLHDSLAGLPEYRVVRSFKPMSQLAPSAASVVFLLSAPVSHDFLDDCRKWAAAGSRVVLVVGPRPKAGAEKPDRKNTPLEEEWQIRFEPSSGDRRWTSFKPLDESWRVLRQASHSATAVEKRAGKGSMVLAGEAILLSNEGLHKERNTEFLLALLGGRREVIFDESHLGVVQSGSVGQLLRRYRLGGAALVLLALFALFFWRSTTSFLPPPAEAAAGPHTDDAVASHAGEDALVNLVRGSVPRSALAGSAQVLWHRSSPLMKASSIARRERVSRVLAEAASAQPLETWRRAHEILKRTST